jgi:hypothetical protein
MRRLGVFATGAGVDHRVIHICAFAKAESYMLTGRQEKPRRHSGEGRNLSPARSMDSGLRRNDDEAIGEVECKT